MMKRILNKKSKYVYCSWTLRTSLLPNKSNTWTMCSLPLVSGSCGAVVHKCARFGFGCARCARCAECRWPWRRFSASVLRSVRTFAECVGLCRRTRRASESVWRLGRVVRASGKTAPERISAWGAKASPGAESGSFSVRREKWRLFRGRPGPSGGGFGDLAKSGAPAAILINAYSGDFCHPVLSNALAQEPLVYHSGTRELFFGHFREHVKNRRNRIGHFREFRLFSLFWDFVDFCEFLWKTLKIKNFTFAHVRKTISLDENFLHMFTKLSEQICKCAKDKCANVQMCKKPSCTKCANLQRKYFFKCRNAQICKCTILSNAEFTNAQFLFCV